MFQTHSWFEIVEPFIVDYLNVVRGKAFPCHKFEYAPSIGTHKILSAVCDLRVKSGQQTFTRNVEKMRSM